jgi:hypothetical protein
MPTSVAIVTLRWVHGYPLAEQNLMRNMHDICLLDAHTEDINVVTLDDPELFT